MMTMYHPHRINLTNGQTESVAKALKNKAPISLRTTYNNLIRGDETVNLTQSQTNKLEKPKNKIIAADTKICKPQL